MKEQTWQERFNKLFPSGLVDGSNSDLIATDLVIQFISKEIDKTREETLKELIREHQDNELDGKGYDFYFSIRAKIDELNKLKK